MPSEPIDCKCGHIACVCNINNRHKSFCKFRKAATCSIKTNGPCLMHGKPQPIPRERIADLERQLAELDKGKS